MRAKSGLYKKLAVGLLVALLLPANVYVAYRVLSAGRPAGGEPVLRRAVYHDLAGEYQELNKRWSGRPVAVLLGDSITRRFDQAEYFVGMPLLNRGIFHDTTVGVLRRLAGSLGGLDVSKLFILVGYNDLSLRGDDEIVANIAEILGRVKARQVYLQSILPVSSDRPETNRRIAAINQRLRRLCARGGCVYVDLHRSFSAPGGGMRPELTGDGVHPNAAGYLLYSELLTPLLAR